MSGVIYFKLKNAIQQQQVNFDGSVIQIGDVKRLVAQKQGLGPEGAAELTLYDPNTGDEYTDDGKVIPRNTLVLVKRAPATRFKPLVSSAIGAPTTAPQPAPAPPATAGDDFGGDSFTNKQAGGEEDQALASYLQNSAAGWHREVMQGAQRGRGGRGRGRGAPPMDYRCPRCEAVGAHWLQACPTQGDPAYDRKRARPPVGIPMTRLQHSETGGLVLPGGQTGTLLANESAFAREILGIFPTAAPVKEEDVKPPSPGGDAKDGAVLALPDVAAAGQPGPPIIVPPPVAAPPPPVLAGGGGSGPPLIVPPPAAAPPPVLVGDEELHPPSSTNFFDLFMRSPLMPRGPPEVLAKAYGSQEPLPRKEFERLQDEYRHRYNMPPLRRRPRSRSPHRSRSRRRSSSRERRRERSRSRTRDERSKRPRSERDDTRDKDKGKEREKDKGKERSSKDEKPRREKDKVKEEEGKARRSSRSDKETVDKKEKPVEKKSERERNGSAAVKDGDKSRDRSNKPSSKPPSSHTDTKEHRSSSDRKDRRDKKDKRDRKDKDADHDKVRETKASDRPSSKRERTGGEEPTEAKRERK